MLALSRKEPGSPIRQQLALMTNYSKTECYSNSALALLLANPVFNSFLSNAGNSSSLINAFNALAHCNPNAILNGYQLRSELENVVPRGYNTYTSQEDCYLFLVDLLEGLEREMPEHLASSFHSLLQLNVTRDSVCSNGHPLIKETQPTNVLTLPLVDDNNANELNQSY